MSWNNAQQIQGYQNLDSKVIAGLKSNLLINMQVIMSNRANLRPGQLEALSNHHNFLIDFLSDMVSVQNVENTDVYNQWMKPFSIDAKSRHNPGQVKQEWEAQFDESLNLNPPCYIMPPQSITGLDAISRAARKA
jgi:hypothetical protein